MFRAGYLQVDSANKQEAVTWLVQAEPAQSLCTPSAE